MQSTFTVRSIFHSLNMSIVCSPQAIKNIIATLEVHEIEVAIYRENILCGKGWTGWVTFSCHAKNDIRGN